MSNTQSPLLQELACAADSHNIKDQLMRGEYINELQTSNDSNEVADSIEILKRMQVDDIQMASRLMLTAREMQTKVQKKQFYYAVVAGLGIWKRTGYSLKDKNEAKTNKNRAREWKGREKSKSAKVKIEVNTEKSKSKTKPKTKKS
ncbi:hypothetical protein Tco_1291938 [Tanacetum coccineum]